MSSARILIGIVAGLLVALTAGAQCVPVWQQDLSVFGGYSMSASGSSAINGLMTAGYVNADEVK